MADVRNPYAPPAAAVADPTENLPDGPDVFIPNGRRVSFGRGARWIGDAWRLFTSRPGKWLLSFLLLLLIYIVFAWVPLANILNTLLWPFLGAGIVMAADVQRRTGTFTVETLFAGFRRPAPLLILGAMYLLSLVLLYASFAIMVGEDGAKQFVLQASAASDAAPPEPRAVVRALLLYTILVLPITAATYLAPPLIMLQGIGAGTAMKMSFIGSIKNILPGIVFIICTLLFILVSIIPLGLGLFVSVPVLMITNYTVYRDIFIDSR